MSHRYRCLFALPPLALIVGVILLVLDRLTDRSDPGHDWPISYHDWDDMR